MPGQNFGDVVSRRYYSEGEFLPLGGTSLYYAQDQLGSVRDVLAAQNGTRVASFDYEPFGNPSQSYGRISTDFRFAGMFYDQQDGIYLTKNRAYDPKAGRWLSRDPLGETAGFNAFSYVGDNPPNTADPLGLDGVTIDWGALRQHWNEGQFWSDSWAYAKEEWWDWRWYDLSSKELLSPNTEGSSKPTSRRRGERRRS